MQEMLALALLEAGCVHGRPAFTYTRTGPEPPFCDWGSNSPAGMGTEVTDTCGAIALIGVGSGKLQNDLLKVGQAHRWVQMRAASHVGGVWQ